MSNNDDCDVSDCTEPATQPALRQGERIHVCGRHARLFRSAGSNHGETLGRAAYADHGDGVRTDGGFNGDDHAELTRVADAAERQADALEALAERQRVTNAALVELIRTVDARAAQVIGIEEPHATRSGRSVAGWVEDAALNLAETVDLGAVDRVRTDGGSTHYASARDAGDPPEGNRMAKVTVRLPDDLIDDLDAAAEQGPYQNRSQAIRDAVRRLVDDRLATDGGERVGTIGARGYTEPDPRPTADERDGEEP